MSIVKIAMMMSDMICMNTETERDAGMIVLSLLASYARRLKWAPAGVPSLRGVGRLSSGSAGRVFACLSTCPHIHRCV